MYLIYTDQLGFPVYHVAQLIDCSIQFCGFYTNRIITTRKYLNSIDLVNMKIYPIQSYYESGVSPVSKRYMRAGIGNDRLVVCLSEYLP